MVFSIVYHSEIPPSWRHSETVPIHKGKDLPTSQLDSFRPISLADTILKLYTGTIHQSLGSYAESNGLLSENQYGFRSGRRTHEQVLWLQTLIDTAHVDNRDIRACWIDFRNAFCSVDHKRIIDSMKQQGYEQHFINAVAALYAPGSTTEVRTDVGPTPPIPIERGILQGDTLSPLIFAIFLEPLLRKLELSNKGFAPLSQPGEEPWGNAVGAYADDLVLTCATADQMQAQLQIVNDFCDWSGMSTNNGKCGYGGWAKNKNWTVRN